ncbi:MAG: hypothetical protein JO100_06355 [Pseudonocardia sp.]|nr:hypothetical protein [Pseudonocardia sp.]
MGLSVVVVTVAAVVSSLHEMLVEMFRHRPQLAAELLTGALGVDLPVHEQVRVDTGECTDVIPTQYRADAVVVLMAANQPVLAVVVEVQLGRDGDKRWSWPVYVATLRARLRCPTALLVICVDATAATWCATPIELGPGTKLVPFVLGPNQVPVLTNASQAKRVPELAVLSALAHGADPNHGGVLDALLDALTVVDAQRAALYSDVVFAALPGAARAYLEALMSTGTYEYQSEFVRKYIIQGRAEGKAEGKAEGRAEGKAEGVLTFLDARGIGVPEDARTRITSCYDLDQLDIWIRRAATADTINDLFE